MGVSMIVCSAAVSSRCHRSACLCYECASGGTLTPLLEMQQAQGQAAAVTRLDPATALAPAVAAPPPPHLLMTSTPCSATVLRAQCVYHCCTFEVHPSIFDWVSKEGCGACTAASCFARLLTSPIPALQRHLRRVSGRSAVVRRAADADGWGLRRWGAPRQPRRRGALHRRPLRRRPGRRPGRLLLQLLVRLSNSLPLSLFTPDTDAPEWLLLGFTDQQPPCCGPSGLVHRQPPSSRLTLMLLSCCTWGSLTSNLLAVDQAAWCTVKLTIMSHLQ